MSAHIEKILLGLAVLILLGGVGASFTLGGGSANDITTEITETDLTGAPYEPIHAPSVSFRQKEWEEPPYQDAANEAWQYGVFTPPKIFVDPRTGVLIEEPPVPPVVIPFGLRLVSMAHPVYPVSFEAYFDSATGDARDASITLFHKELNASSGIVGVGDTLEDWGITITDLDVDKRGTAATGLETVATVTIRDNKLQRSFTFSPGDKIELEDKNIITVAPSDSPSDSEVWREVGDEFYYSNSAYTLLEIDFDKRSITVKKDSPELEEPETLTLFERGSSVPKSTKETSSSSESSSPSSPPSSSGGNNAIDDSFESMF